MKRAKRMRDRCREEALRRQGTVGAGYHIFTRSMPTDEAVRARFGVLQVEVGHPAEAARSVGA